MYNIRISHQWVFNLLILILLFPAYSFSQKVANTKELSVVKWQLDTVVDGVKFYHAIEMRNGQKIVFLKLDNMNKKQVEVSWREVFKTQLEEHVESYLGEKTLVVKPGETTETNYETPVRKELVVYPKQVTPTYLVDISNFNYQSIKVSQVH